MGVRLQIRSDAPAGRGGYARALLVSVAAAALAAPAQPVPPAWRLLPEAAPPHPARPIAQVVAPRAPPVVRIVLPPAVPVAAGDLPGAVSRTGPTLLASEPLKITATLPAPVTVLDIPAAPARLATAPAGKTAPVAAPPAPSEIAQLSRPSDSSAFIVQLNEPAAAMASTLADRVAGMQATLPPPVRLSQTERAAMLAEAPGSLTVRRGAHAIGSLAFHIVPTGGVNVELSGLLDLVRDQMPPEEFARLRTSSAAGSFVALDTLRAAGIDLRYDAAYDEFRLAG